MKIHQYVSNGKIGNFAEKSQYSELIESMSRCTSDIEVWTIANIEFSGTQIDLMILKEDGVLCVDFKNYEGDIRGEENGWYIDNKKIERKNWFSQAKIQKSSVGRKMVEILSLQNGKETYYFKTRQLVCVRPSSKIDIKGISKTSGIWFGVITPEQICGEINEYEGETLSKEDIKKIIRELGAEPIDYGEYLEQISAELPERPYLYESDIFHGNYEDIYKKLASIHDNIRNPYELWMCEYAMALTQKDARKTLPDLLNLKKRYPSYEDYGTHSILEDIFDYFIEYQDEYESEIEDKVAKLYLEITSLEMKYAILKKVTDDRTAVEWPDFMEDMVPELYHNHPSDPVLLVEMLRYSIRKEDDKAKTLMEKILFDTDTKKALNIKTFNGILAYDPYSVISLYDENSLFELLKRMKEEYGISYEEEENIVLSIYYIKKRLYKKAYDVAIEGKENALTDELKRRHLLLAIYSLRILHSQGESSHSREERIRLYEHLQEYISLEKSTCFIYEWNYEIQEELRSKGDMMIERSKMESDLKAGVKGCGSRQMYYLLAKVCKGYDTECAIENFETILRFRLIDEPWDWEYQTKFYMESDDIPPYYRWIESISDYWPTKRTSELNDIEKESLKEIIDIYVSTKRFKELFCLVEGLKTYVNIDRSIYSDAYRELSKWLDRQNELLQGGTSSGEQKQKTGTTLEDVILNERTRRKIQRFVESTKKSNRPNSILLHGPPGCGKTMLAEAMANELSYEFEILSPSDIINPLVGVSEQTIASVFEKARERGRVLIFLDELESFTFDRSTAERSWELTLQNELMTQIERTMKSDIPIIVVGATNYLYKVDRALRRSGRFNYKIEIDLPEGPQRAEIFRKKLKTLNDSGNYTIDEESIDFSAISKETEGMSGADINTIVNDHIVMYVEFEKGDESLKIDMDDILHAIYEFKEGNSDSSDGTGTMYM